MIIFFKFLFIVVFFIYDLSDFNHNTSGDLAKLPLYLLLSYSAG